MCRSQKTNKVSFKMLKKKKKFKCIFKVQSAWFPCNPDWYPVYCQFTYFCCDASENLSCSSLVMPYFSATFSDVILQKIQIKRTIITLKIKIFCGDAISKLKLSLSIPVIKLKMAINWYSETFFSLYANFYCVDPTAGGLLVPNSMSTQ